MWLAFLFCVSLYDFRPIVQIKYVENCLNLHGMTDNDTLANHLWRKDKVERL